MMIYGNFYWSKRKVDRICLVRVWHFFHLKATDAQVGKKKLGQGTEIKRAVGVGIECLGVACHLSTFCEDLRRWLAARKQ
jgi:hypothetical protein